MVRLTVHCDLFLMGRNPNATAGAPHSKIVSRFDRFLLRIHLQLVSFIVIAPFESVRRWPYCSLPDAGTRFQGRSAAAFSARSAHRLFHCDREQIRSVRRISCSGRRDTTGRQLWPKGKSASEFTVHNELTNTRQSPVRRSHDHKTFKRSVHLCYCRRKWSGSRTFCSSR
jgi:hypothetical protein